MKLVPIPKDEYDDYRLDAIFKAYKWDPQFSDANTLSKHVLVVTDEEHAELVRLTEQLCAETVAAEKALCGNLKLSKALRLPRAARKEQKKMKNYQEDRHIRLMRFDFHPTAEGGWAISEVNSDVPGGFAEASMLPGLAAQRLKGEGWRHVVFGEILANAIASKVKPDGCVMLIHCTSYSDDRQVMQYLGDKLESIGLKAIYAAADHLRFIDKKAVSILGGSGHEVDAIFRFTPLEWLVGMKPKRWQGYFDTTTPSCNHPIAVFAQTKRFPFVWDALEKLGVELPAWRELLPETIEVKDAMKMQGASAGMPPDGYIYKPALGRVGEGISIREACKEDEYKKILKNVKKRPMSYIAQRRFNSKPLISEDGEEYHICIGAYTVDGKAAGYYARASKSPRIDSKAEDIPVLIGIVGRGIPDAPSLSVGCGIPDAPQKPVDTFRSWAPAGAMWTQWVRPATFAAMSGEELLSSSVSFTIPQVFHLEKLEPDTALFLDLPGFESIVEGIALAKIGWRPIPLFNFTDAQRGAMATVETDDIKCALIWGAEELKKLDVAATAPPAFLLDSNRINRHKMDASVFDNSWDIFDQDVPSVDNFLSAGVSKFIVHGQKIHRDLAQILYKFQTKGIKILLTNGFEKAREVSVKKPPRKYGLSDN